MREDEIRRQAEEIDREIHHEEHHHPKKNHFFRSLVSIFMLLIIVLMIVPFYSIKYNPEPTPITEIQRNWEYNYTDSRLNQLEDVYNLDISNIVRNVAIQISSDACKSNSDVCYSKALFYYVRDKVNYISDPPYEYIQSPEETLLGAGDCEDKSILLAYLLKSIGIKTRIVIVPGHAYIEAYVPEAPNKYKTDNWIPLDTTCSYCGYGEIPMMYGGEVIRRISV